MDYMWYFNFTNAYKARKHSHIYLNIIEIETETIISVIFHVADNWYYE